MRFRNGLPALIAVAALVVPTQTAQSVDGCPDKAQRSKTLQWPAAPERGEFDIVHFGEAHWNEGQGPLTMPILVQDVVAANPELVLFSSDIADIGTVDRLACFRTIMRPVDEAGIPWFASPGNHDRVAIAGPGGVANGAIDMWRSVFAAMPAPWGDGSAASLNFHVPEGEPGDGEGASTHYYFDYGTGRKPSMRVIVLDNSQQSLTSSDADQYPPVGPGEADVGQLAFLERVAADAQSKGLVSVVVMHQPTQDPRDVSNVHPVSLNHTMGKGASADNAAFDAIAQVTGIDLVVLGHIQGNATYSVGETNYYIDGGGGGSPYALREVGTDTGYFYGFRILRMYDTPGGSSTAHTSSR
jgi:3',5'-cyclic AMP phosphodiesterase CpdA